MMRKKTESVLFQIRFFAISSRSCLQQKKLFGPEFYRSGGRINGLVFRYSFSISVLILTDAEMGGLSYPWLNSKILTVNDPYFEHLRGIVCALRSSPMLEKLVINLQLDQHQEHIFPGVEIDCEKENYLVQYSNKTVFNCSVSILRTVKIVGLSDRDEKHKFVLNFVKFLLKNAGVLEKIVIVLADCGACFPFEVSNKLLSFQRCFPRTTIELLRSN